MEPTRGSDSKIGLSLSIPFESIFQPGSPNGPSQEELGWMLRQIPSMSERELADRYEQIIDKISLPRANGSKYKHEALLATEAALIAQRYDKQPTLDHAKMSVVQDINAAVQMIQEERRRPAKAQVSSDVGDECDKPF